MYFKRKNTNSFGWEGLNGCAFNSKEDFHNASAAYLEVTGQHGKVKTTLSDRVYYVLEGEGFFEVDGVKTKVIVSDVVIVPRDTPYNYWVENGVMKLFLVHTPAFDAAHEVKLD